ncbi:Pkr1-domain-containing protein [Coniochaeta ligniaria NRRL 30616]|uniref:Pkr1-domain-containing protein n=1 Tax=Coniochaeta ligniaria NRRL 30616 TaxID=1408157 RepID=A0A1J7JQE6_9PEZI|nr:Pkr1-domain-containing protein [Coniochaeta ligniaria NRRL 30616]
MATFVSDLWESIFTPGPTPTLLIATNVTFAALQLVLGLLLVATHSIHFVVLSAISGGLWWSINWFARELKIHQQQEEEKARRAEQTPIGRSDDSETEVEGRSTVGANRGRGRAGAPVVIGGESDDITKAASASNEVEVVQKQGELKQRVAAGDNSPSQGTKSSVSTEDEWEKVSENENEKDK